ncbi:MAG: hypothetical protein AB1478_02725 [Nitrospirota bacterium]
MRRKIPTYNYLPANELPPYQLYKRWQEATGYSEIDKFGKLSREKMLQDIKTYKSSLLSRQRESNKIRGYKKFLYPL